jgi:hypothetical protein
MRAQEPMKMEQLNQMTLEEAKRMSQQIQKMGQETLKTELGIQMARESPMGPVTMRAARMIQSVRESQTAQVIQTVQESRTKLEAMETAQQIQRMPRKKQAQKPRPRELQSCQAWMEASRQSRGRYHNRWPRERYHQGNGRLQAQAFLQEFRSRRRKPIGHPTWLP